VVGGDVGVVGVGDVVDLQAGVEVGEVDQPVVGGQAGQALLLVLVVRAGPAALGAKAGRVVPGRGAGRGEEGHQDRVGLVGDVDGGDVAGGVVAVLAECFAVDDDEVAAGEGDGGVDGDGGAERGVDAQGGDVGGVVFVGDVEDDQAAAHPRAVGPVAEGVGAAVQGQAVLGVGAAGGQLALVAGGVGFAGCFVLAGVPSGAGLLGGGRVGDVNNGEDLAFEAGQVAGGIHPGAAVVEVAVGAGAAADPGAQQLGPVGFVHVPDEEAVLRLGVRAAEGQAGRRVLQRGDHEAVGDLYLDGHGVRRPGQPAQQLRVLGVGHLQDGPPGVPEPGDVQEEPPPGFLQGQLQSGPAVEVVVGEQVHVVAPHGKISALRQPDGWPAPSGTVNEAAWAISAAISGCSCWWRACSAATFASNSGSSESETSMAANFSRCGMPHSSSRTCTGWFRYAQ